MTGPVAADRSAPAGGERVLIAIVNYRTADLVISALRSLERERELCPDTEVVVVDNDSGDGSAQRIAEAIEARGWSRWVRLQRSAVNGGFAYGNNVAIAPALASASPPDFVWLLNPDAEARPCALRALLDFLRDHPRVGIAGSSIEQADGRPWPHAFRFPSIWSELASGLRMRLLDGLLGKRTVLMTMGDQAERVDWLPGASMIVRRAVFDDVGLMDDGYFLYFEETDFCLQAARRGWSCWYVPDSRVMHIAGQSTGLTTPDVPRRRLPAYWFESRRRYWIKNHGLPYAMAVDIVWALSFATWRLRRWLQRKPDQDPPHMLRDFLHNSVLWHWTMPANPRVRG
jgi:N-acetylglucosaminyl-diphospho-decaprenol L-rhamnosyltransferase